MKFLSHDFTPNDLGKFKENISALFTIIYYCNSIKNKKGLITLIIELLFELISEENFNFLDSLEPKENSETMIFELIRNKFTLCFLLFDKFMKQQKNIAILINNHLDGYFLQKYDIFINFYFSIFNNVLYAEPFNAYQFLKQKIFYNNNQFIKKELIQFNIKNAKNKKNLNYFIGYFEYIIEIIIIKNIFPKHKLDYFIKFIELNAKSQDNFSIIYGIIEPLIKYFKSNEKEWMHNISNSILKFIYINYYDVESKKISKTFQVGETFYGEKYDKKLIPNIFEFTNNDDKIIYLIFGIIIYTISEYYEEFSNFEYSSNYSLNSLNDDNNIIYLNNLANSVEFYNILFSYEVYDKLLFLCYYLSEIISKFEILPMLSFGQYLNNIFFIMDFLRIRCMSLDKNNLINNDEPYIISKILKNILNYACYFLSHISHKINYKNFKTRENYEKNIYFNILIFIKLLKFDANIIKEAIPNITTNLILMIKNLYELSIIKENKIIGKIVNKLIEELYSYGLNKGHNSENGPMKKILFNTIMTEENKNYKPSSSETDINHHNNLIKNTMYYNMFMIIYNKIKILRDSLHQAIIEKNDLNNFENIKYLKIYILKFIKGLNIFYNFIMENDLLICYDINCILFLKINSFLCKTSKKLLTDENIKLLYLLSSKIEEDIVKQFFTQLFLVMWTIIYKKEYFENNFYKKFLFEISKNRKGFHFAQFRNSIIKYFQNNKDYIYIIEFLNNAMSNLFEYACIEVDTLDENDVNDNSFEIESRTICSICQMDSPTLDAHLKDCNHQYHMTCIKQLIKSNSSCSRKCPLCKRLITGIKEDPNFKIENNNSLDNKFPLFGENNFSSNIFSNNPFLINNRNLDRNDNNETNLFLNIRNVNPTQFFNFDFL